MGSAEDAPGSLGSWKPADLAETARTGAGAGADDDLPPILRFKASIAKLLRRRRAQPDAGSDVNRPAVFLLQATPPEIASGVVAKREPMLDSGAIPMNGRIWFVSPVAACGHCVDCDVAEDDKLFRLVTDTLGLGATPAIVFDPRPSGAETRFYPGGLGDPET